MKGIVMVYGCPVPPEDADAIQKNHAPAHVDPSPTIPPQAHDELGPVAELQPDGQGGRAPAGLPRVNLAVLRAACDVQGWRLTIRDGGESFTIADGTSAVEYEQEVYADGVRHELSARGRFDGVLDMMAVLVAASLSLEK